MPPLQHKSRCVFCSSTDYGKGCRFGPHKTHFHSSDPTKCSFCGSRDYGKGCRLNPTDNLHIHGSVHNNMYRENVQSFLDTSVLINEIKKNFSDFECYKLGIIDSNGNKIKNPVTEQEFRSYGALTKTIIKLKKYLGSKCELIEATTILEKNCLPSEDISHYKKIIEYQQQVDCIMNSLYETLDKAQAEGISADEIKKILKA